MRPPDSRTDENLLRDAEHDPAAFAIFYRRHLPLVVAALMRATRDRELSADLAAEVFAAALVARKSFDSRRASASTWLLTIASNKLTDSLRRSRVDNRARRRLSMAPVALEDTDLDRVDELASLEHFPTADEMLGFLPEPARTAVRRRIIDEWAYRDIANAMDCSESVVRQRVSRGLAAIRDQLPEAT